MRAKITASGLALALPLLALTACGGSADQSVEDACAIAQSTVEAAQAEVEDTLTSAGSGDFGAVVEGMTTMGNAISEAEAKVTQVDVKAALASFAEGIEGFVAAFDGIEDGDMETLAAKSAELEAAATNITEASTKLADLCPDN